MLPKCPGQMGEHGQVHMIFFVFWSNYLTKFHFEDWTESFKVWSMWVNYREVVSEAFARRLVIFRFIIWRNSFVKKVGGPAQCVFCPNRPDTENQRHFGVSLCCITRLSQWSASFCRQRQCSERFGPPNYGNRRGHEINDNAFWQRVRWRKSMTLTIKTIARGLWRMRTLRSGSILSSSWDMVSL